MGDYKGLAWLFLGVANSDALLYDDEWQPIVKNFPDNFKLDYALSREQKNKAGGKMYIQGEGHRLGGQAQGVEEERPVARRGVLNSGRRLTALELGAMLLLDLDPPVPAVALGSCSSATLCS